MQKELNQNKYHLHITQSEKIYKLLRSKNIKIKEIIFAEEFKLYKSNVCTFQKVTTIHHSKKLFGRHPPLSVLKQVHLQWSTVLTSIQQFIQWSGFSLGKANRRSPEPSSSLHFFLFQDIFVTNVSKKMLQGIQSKHRNGMYNIEYNKRCKLELN